MLLNYNAPEYKNNWSGEEYVDSIKFLKQQFSVVSLYSAKSTLSCQD